MLGGKIKIWGRNNSSNVQKVLWVCAELEIPFERIDLGGPFGGNDTPEYRALNPNGLVPTVEDGEVVIWESNTCVRYLAATRGGTRLYPPDARQRADIERWMDWQLSTLGPALVPLMFGLYRTPPEKRDAAGLEKARQEGIRVWGIVDRWLATRPFLAGNGFTLADIPTGIWAYRWFQFPIERPAYANLEAWYRRLAEHAGFKQHIAQPLS
jgi:glutathione S-transferase